MGARRGLRAVLALGALAASAHGQSIAMVLLLQFKIIRLLEQPWSAIDSLAHFYETDFLRDIDNDFTIAASVVFSLMQNFRHDASFDSMYLARDSDGSFVGYFNKENATSYEMSFLPGWDCPWNYTAACNGTAPCPEGYRATTRVPPRRDDDSYLPEGQTTCERCDYPTKTASPRTRGVYACNACEPGYYVVADGGAYACEECPHGGVCEGGTAQPYPEEGFWGLRDHPTEFRECGRDRACKGGPDFECYAGYSGRQCERMANDRFRVAGTQYPCPASPGARRAATLAMVLTVFALWHVINAVVCETSDVTDMLLMTVQQCAIVFEFDLGWPASLSYLEPLFEVALFDVDLVQPNCVVTGWTYYDGFYVQLVLPLVYALSYFLPIAGRFAAARVRAFRSGAPAASVFAACHHYDGFLGRAVSTALAKSLVVTDICHTTIAVKTLEVWRAGGMHATYNPFIQARINDIEYGFIGLTGAFALVGLVADAYESLRAPLAAATSATFGLVVAVAAYLNGNEIMEKKASTEALVTVFERILEGRDSKRARHSAIFDADYAKRSLMLSRASRSEEDDELKLRHAHLVELFATLDGFLSRDFAARVDYDQLLKLCGMSRALAPYTCDESPTSVYNRHHRAHFWRRLLAQPTSSRTSCGFSADRRGDDGDDGPDAPAEAKADDARGALGSFSDGPDEPPPPPGAAAAAADGPKLEAALAAKDAEIQELERRLDEAKKFELINLNCAQTARAPPPRVVDELATLEADGIPTLARVDRDDVAPGCGAMGCVPRP
ncbi:hypothetical protein JL721_959 [Aureococcus anophagefferens]|nr:hypothetical protein JL721_959 [Aureococcus anophagefferens]